jgi:hypothetical protein
MADAPPLFLIHGSLLTFVPPRSHRGVVLNKNAVNAAMFLLLSLVGMAGLFVLLDAYLLAFLLMLVYAGAVVALFLFIVMLLDMHPGRAQGLQADDHHRPPSVPRSARRSAWWFVTTRAVRRNWPRRPCRRRR